MSCASCGSALPASALMVERADEAAGDPVNVAARLASKPGRVT
jgi:class 3 adenylate cyclase